MKLLNIVKWSCRNCKVLGFVVVLLLLNSTVTKSQTTESVTEEELEFLITTIADSLAFYYVDAAMGVQIGNSLKTKWQNGVYQHLHEPERLAKQITEDLRSVNGDLHLYVNYIKQEEETAGSESSINEKYGASTNYGFQEIKFLEGNIAYLRISHFTNWNFANRARQKITELMGLFQNSEAFIVDLRDNKGGVPYVASLLASYFFEDEPVHLADFYTRFNDYSYGIHTEPLIHGMKYPEIPLFIIVNNKSASAAEEFAFWLQNHQRATIVGEATAGAGYGALNHQLNDRFSISISSEEEINPITKKGFQGVGVLPDVSAHDSASYAITLQLAKKSIKSEERRDSTRLKTFLQLLEKDEDATTEIQIYEEVLTLHNLGFLSYNDINNLGYQYIATPQKSIPILKANTVLYPFYPNPFDSYGEALAQAGKYELARTNYNKAVQLAQLKNNPGLDQFIRNRENFIEQYNLKE